MSRAVSIHEGSINREVKTMDDMTNGARAVADL
jgi:hypothetical protein